MDDRRNSRNDELGIKKNGKNTTENIKLCPNELGKIVERLKYNDRATNEHK